jgi:hypothetical protein
MLPTRFRFNWLRRFLEIDQSETRINCLWLPMNRDEMINLYRGPSIVAFYQVSVHLVKWFQRRFLNDLKFGRKHLWKVLYKECLFCTDSLTNMAAIGSSCLDASYQVSIQLAKKIFRNRPIRNKN